MSKIRLSFCRNTGNEKGKEISGVLVNQNYNEILMVAKNKLKIKSKNIKLFVARKFNSIPAGLELNENNIDCLFNDVVICVSQGEDFSLAKDKKGEECSITCPYIWNFENNIVYNTKEENEDKEMDNEKNISSDQITTFKKLPLPYQKLEMNNQFPILEGNILSYLKEITRENNTIFVEKDFGDYSSFDYKSSTIPTFPNPSQFKNQKDIWIAGLKRECRGLIICNKSGKVLARRFHKFFNINENEESDVQNINLTSNAFLTRKIDGSLVSPFILNDKLVWATRSIIQDSIKTFIEYEKDNISYDLFSEYCIKTLNSTPLFEWCENDRIVGVIEHSYKSLTLLAIRNITTGEYIQYHEFCSFAKKYNIPFVDSVPISVNISETIKKILDIPEIEGYVLRLENNDMYKIKTLWYTSLAQASKNGSKKNSSFLLELIKKRPIIKYIPIYRIYEACLNANLDDNIAMCCTLLNKLNANEDAKYLQYISTQFLNSIDYLHHKIIGWIENEEKKEKSETIIQAMINSGWPNLMAIAYVKSKFSAKDILIRKIRENCNFRYYLNLEDLLQISFQQIKIVFPNFKLTPTPIIIQNHILEKYLPAKISNYLGITANQLDDKTIINIPSSYNGSEGKIKGFWELFENDGIIDLRIDLQPPRKKYDEHFGDTIYSHWQVQFGVNLKCEKSSGFKKGCEETGSFAGVLLPTDKNIPFYLFKDAFKQSFNTKNIIQINKNFNYEQNASKFEINQSNKQNKQKYKLFCDLDGVLVNFEKGVFSLTGKYTSQFNKNSDMWKEIAKKNNFWTELEWAQDGKTLWDFIINNKDSWNYEILTGVPEGKMGKDADKQKHIWCQKNLETEINVNVCLGSLKHKFSNPKNILIDDRLEYKEKWENNGGIFIHHINSNQTIEQLQNLIGTSYYNINSNLVVMVDNDTENKDLFLNIIKDNNMNLTTINVEWRPDEIVQSIYPDCFSLPALIQLNFNNSDRVFLIDCLTLGENKDIIEHLIFILGNKNITKVFYGLKEDLSRIIALFKYHQKDFSAINSIINIHDILCNKFKTDKFSLKTASQKILNLEIEKNKNLQVSDWELRPLSLSQQKYAAIDAHILMKIYDVMKEENMIIGDKNVTNIDINQIINFNDLKKYIFSSTEFSQNNNDIYNLTPLCHSAPIQEINFEYLALFLTTQSRNLILELFPPLYNNRFADHITLIHKSDLNLNSNLLLNNRLNLGENQSFQIIGKCTDNKCQTLIVKLINKNNKEFIQDTNNQYYHLTISTISGVPPSYSNELIQREFNQSSQVQPIDKNVFTGKIILLISLDKEIELLSGLPEDIKSQILDLVDNEPNGTKIKFKNGLLSSNERKTIHDFADYYHLSSESDGPKDNRQLILTKPNKWVKPDLNSEQNEKEKIIKISSDKHGKKQKVTFRPQQEVTFRLIFDNTIIQELKFKNINNNSKTNFDGQFDLEKGIILNDSSNINNSTKIIQNILSGKQVSNTVIIMRGLPGSGKSSLSDIIQTIQYDNTIICSADKYFEKLKNFDENKLQEAHEYSRNTFIDALENKTNIIIVDNTNITLDRYSFYKRKAKNYKYQVIIIEMVCNSQTSHERNIHQVPLDKISKMHRLWETDLEDYVIRLTTNQSFGLSKSDCNISKSNQTLSQF